MSTIRTVLTTATLAGILGATLATGAVAHDTRRIDRIQDRQLLAIEEGRRDGSITRREYRELKAEQAYIADLERHARADGRLTSREVRAIRAAQRDARVHISRERTDGQVNLWRRWKSRHGF
jgi:hypothetical protein